MKPTSLGLFLLLTGVATLLGAALLGGDEPPRTGPLTEKRFPPLKVPAGFSATLFACGVLSFVSRTERRRVEIVRPEKDALENRE